MSNPAHYTKRKASILRNEIKEKKKEITKIKLGLEGENMTRKHKAAVMWINLSPRVIFSSEFQINLWSFVEPLILSCEVCVS